MNEIIRLMKNHCGLVFLNVNRHEIQCLLDQCLQCNLDITLCSVG